MGRNEPDRTGLNLRINQKPRTQKVRGSYHIKKSKSKDDVRKHGKRAQPKRHPQISADSQKREDQSPEITAATVNLWTPVSTTSSSSLGAVAWRRRTLEGETGLQDKKSTEKALEKLKQTTKVKREEGSLGKIRSDLQHMGVRTSSPATPGHRINVFNDSVWEEYGKSSDVLVFDLEDGDTEVKNRKAKEGNKVLGCEWYPERQPYPCRGRGRYNAEWSIKPAQKDGGRHRVGEFAGGMYCRRLYNTKLASAHKDKFSAFKVYDRTHNPRIQALIMDLGDTPTPDSPSVGPIPNGNPDFYAAVDDDDDVDLPYADCDQATRSDKDILTTTVKSHHDFEVDPQTCWPCVGCQDDEVPATMRWCSVM